MFTLGENEPETGIIDATRTFLSFQSGRWVGIPTIICNPPITDNPLANRAWLGELELKDDNPRNAWTASDWTNWPGQFNEFWKKYTDENHQDYVQHSVQHYVDCAGILGDGTLNYSMVASISTLQALTRWWNSLGEDFQFGPGRGKRFIDLLCQAVQKAELGLDEQKQIDSDDMLVTVKQANDFRNKIDHGQGGARGLQTQRMVDCQLYCHNLARFLILAKLGDRGTHARGCLVGPKFIDRTQGITSC